MTYAVRLAKRQASLRVFSSSVFSRHILQVADAWGERPAERHGQVGDAGENVPYPYSPITCCFELARKTSTIDAAVERALLRVTCRERLSFEQAVAGPQEAEIVDPQTVLNRLEDIRAETLRYLDGLTQQQLDWRPPQGGRDEWSLGEVFMHLAIDEIYVRELIARPLLEGIKPPDGVRFLPPPPPYGTPKDVIRFWFECAREQTRRLFDDWPADANLAMTHEGGLEEMNGLAWLEGYGGHEAFHRQQIDRLLTGVP
jgi:hypothetical protein